MIRVLGRRTSNNVQKVLWLLAEMNLPCRQEDYGGTFGGTNTPEYLRLNPNATVPTLIDDGMVLWESNAIVRYLARKHGSPLSPNAPAGQALVEQWMDWQIATLSPAFRPLYIALVREKQAVADLGDVRKPAARLFSILDQAVSERPFISGNEMTLADIAIGPMIFRWFTLGLAGEDYPHLARLLERLAARPAFQQHVMIEMA